MAGADVPASGGGKGGRRVSIYIDMTPMVDVIILLLIFFFMTSQFKEPAAVEVKLPKLGAAEEKFIKVKESNVLTVKVDDAGTISILDIYNRDGTEINLEELGEYIGQRQQDNEELITIIDVSPQAKYSDMIDVLDEFKMASEQTGNKRISLQLEEVPETAATAEPSE
jgi:biopolymer transport protein ExbD